MKDDKIHVVLTIFDPRGDYSRHAGVVLLSMFTNTNSSICVHILHDDTLNKDNREKFIELAEKYKQELDFIDISMNISKLSVDVDKLTRRFTRGSLYRLFIQDLLLVDKVIYLDCDVVVELDIKELWDIDLNDCRAGVVFEGEMARGNGGNSKRRFFCRYAGIDEERYFNSGVLILNLKKISEDMNICALASEFFLRYPDTIVPDQDFLNRVFQENMREIDNKFNYFVIGIDDPNMKGKLWHYNKMKPWEISKGLQTDALYWRYFSMTPWCSDLISEMTKAHAKSACIHLHSSDCSKTILRNLIKSFSPKNVTPLYKIMVIWHDIAYRIRKKFKI